ncbi:alpha/beta hydrolase family protein [Nitrolancea hollandica]|uniref:alpha/beta hydrolase family protein n=1 Tax=Nitrolancea hollandica TaxID=1206749 RepID=UPI00135F116D|nr:alpha/beta hydrolase family protein [Nitrolancea hollandica]
MKLVFDNPSFDAQLLRTISYTAFDGADISECIETARRIKEGDRESWYAEWLKTADRVRQGAEESLKGGHRVSAHHAYLRASNYYRTAEFFVNASAEDPRSLKTWQSSHDCFIQAAALAEPTFEVIQIPYESMTLPGYFFRVDDSAKPRPTIITMTGLDGYAEETYFSVAHAGLRRGYNCLAFDGPGQGGVLRQDGIPFRPDWEAVVTPVLDYVLTRSDVDPKRITIIGRSFGGYLAPRAASAEHRLAACIADPGEFDLFEMALSRMPQELRDQIIRDDPAVDAIFAGMMRDDAARFFFTSRMRAFGAKSLRELFQMWRKYTLKGRAGRITCPALVCDNADDPAASQARRLYDALTSPKGYIRFTGEEAAGGHCEGGAQVLFSRRIYDWLDDTLGIIQAPEVETVISEIWKSTVNPEAGSTGISGDH